MGSRFELTVVHSSEATARQLVDAGYTEIERIEALISSWRETSQTSEINRNAGVRPVAVAPELVALVERAVKVSALTGGAFDLTFAGVGRLWDFNSKQPRVPAADEIEQALAKVGFEKIRVDREAATIFLTESGMSLGFGAIGKGYAANKVVELLRSGGAAGGVVNAGGDLFAFGLQEDRAPWRVGIANPADRDSVFGYIQLSNQALVTSGDYESFFEVDGKTYSHILDPRTGYPVDSLRSVTILCPDAELADALATATSVLGLEDGLALIDRLEDIEALVVDQDLQIHTSKNLQSLIDNGDTD